MTSIRAASINASDAETWACIEGRRRSEGTASQPGRFDEGQKPNQKNQTAEGDRLAAPKKTKKAFAAARSEPKKPEGNEFQPVK